MSIVDTYVSIVGQIAAKLLSIIMKLFYFDIRLFNIGHKVTPICLRLNNIFTVAARQYTSPVFFCQKDKFAIF